MKRKYQIRSGNKTIVREYSYIPVRYVVAMMITIIEILAIIGVVVACCYFVPYFYIAALITEFFCVIKIISSEDNPDYKVPWLLVVLVLPVAGFMLYFLFYSRKLQKKFLRRLKEVERFGYEIKGSDCDEEFEREHPLAASSAKMLCKISGAKVFKNTKQTYYPLGEDMWRDMLSDLDRAERFIFLEYFIIEEGEFWNSILEILTRKAKAGVTVRVLYDDIGCMCTLPGNYHKRLRTLGIEATPFSRLRGNADSEFNNRNHRKICVIDGKVGYTGGVNIADEYINKVERFGHWKDTAIRLEGEAVFELTKTFIKDYGINVKNLPALPENLYPEQKDITASGYVVPFGDGPRPLYERRVGKSVIQNMLSSACKYMLITTPYLIIDNEMCAAIENAALRGVDVRIITPHIPDKKMVFGMTRSYYLRLMKAGVRIYEYKPGFIHGKSYVADGECAMIGTINLDYRSLVHHFENGVYMYGTSTVSDIERDIRETMEISVEIKSEMLKTGLITRFIRSLVKIFAPLL